MHQKGFIDLHTHSYLSDGLDSPYQLVAKAQSAGIRVLAITDHNTLTSDFLKLQQAFPAMHLIPGCEVSCIYSFGQRTKELHVVALGCNPQHPKFASILARNNQFDRSIYINKLLARLQECNIYLGTYETLKAAYPETKHLGRKHLATEMFRRGYVNSIDDAFDIYIGAFGQRRAYVQNTASYISLEEAVDAIIASGGIAILAHLFYYSLTDEENRQLLAYFKQLAGDRGAMETNYAAYSTEQRAQLLQLAKEFDLAPSAASDYHGTDAETLAHQFPYEIYENLENHFRI